MAEQTATDIKILTPIQVISFLRSVIRSGEQLTYNDEKLIDGAINQHATLLTENAELKERIMSAKSIRGEKWIIRWEGGDSSMFAKNAGFYAMHDNWEGGEIGPYKTMIEAMQELDKVLKEAKQ